jgi:uncharacterized protein YecA (UPF0149 family)
MDLEKPLSDGELGELDDFLESDIIPLTVGAIYDYWKPQRQNPTDAILLDDSPVHREVKVSRNAPCPCGSGRKYKKCCGTKLN